MTKKFIEYSIGALESCRADVTAQEYAAYARLVAKAIRKTFAADAVEVVTNRTSGFCRVMGFASTVDASECREIAQSVWDDGEFWASNSVRRAIGEG